MEEEFKKIKSSRASQDIFDDLEVKAYGEMQSFQDVAKTLVKGEQLLIVKVFDESVKDEVVKTLTRSEMDIEVQMEGKDIRIKMGQGKAEHVANALKTIKNLVDDCKKDLRMQRNKM